ncbi:ROK family protein [Paenibacillus polygoni]|uniref:ROK family protein n=1 Tax=Paenibacillus polygoni TaxID=3050112 RepID=A0ABY8X418_9BACL|nr:ROK family protein [Paenibacillus polygoni]WIV18714.1 ROK family protein [Paenibacillus polygoni]
MAITGDQALVKKINKTIILNTIREHAPLSRANVSTLSGLNKATVSNLVAELIDGHLVTELGPGESSGGRKPLMLLFNKHAGYAVGLEVSVKRIRGVLTDLAGAIIAEDVQPLTSHDVSYVCSSIVSMTNGLQHQAPPSPHGIIGVGIGVPGMVDEEGTVLFAPNLGWNMVPLRRMLEKELALPVTIDNEANAGALGELHFGAARGTRHLIYISAGIGIGSGIVIDGELYKGAWGYAGETGHMSIDAEGKQCSCGNRGCWELYASEKAYDEASLKLPSRSTSDLTILAAKGDPIILELYKSMGHRLGVGITNIVNSFNPERIIIGGPLSKAQKYIESSLQRVVAERTLPYHRRSLHIEFAELGANSTLIGSAYGAISQFLGQIRVRS